MKMDDDEMTQEVTVVYRPGDDLICLATFLEHFVACFHGERTAFNFFMTNNWRITAAFYLVAFF